MVKHVAIIVRFGCRSSKHEVTTDDNPSYGVSRTFQEAQTQTFAPEEAIYELIHD